MTLDELNGSAAALHLTALGGFHEDGKTTILLGPREPGFWDFVTDQPTFTGADPLDNWSRGAITTLAKLTCSQAVFPFGGPPHHPFIAWALRSGEVWTSPWVCSFTKRPDYWCPIVERWCSMKLSSCPPPAQSPCDSCVDKPCLSACPVSALTPDAYDVESCKDQMDVDADCRAACRVRMSCPISQAYGRDPAQTGFHMEAFHPS